MTHRSDRALALAHVFPTNRITVNFWGTHQSPRAAVTDHQNRGLKQQKWIFSLSPRTKMSGYCSPSEGSMGDFLWPSPAGEVPSHPGHSLACRHIAPTSTSVVTWLLRMLCPHASFLTRTPVTALGTTLLHYDLTLTQSPQRRPNNSRS